MTVGDAALSVNSTHEFEFTDAHFAFFQTLADETAGIELNETKKELVYGRLVRRLRATGLTDFDSYGELVRSPDSPERTEFVNAITTNLTAFFRERHHFDFLGQEALPDLFRARSAKRRIRIWSSACSTGQEPYSIGITALGAIPMGQTWDCKILATDIDGNVVEQAAAGRYPADSVPGPEVIPGRSRWFQPAAPGDRTEVTVSEELKQMIYFRTLNLMDDWPMQGPIDVIFCRNVVIYFSKETQRQLFRRFAEILAPDGYLFIGHSESILHSADLFESIGRTIYRRRSAR